MAATHFEGGTHHCAIFYGDDHGATHKNFKKCELHPGHKDFMTIDEFAKKAPSEIGLSSCVTSIVWNIINRSVRVVVDHTSAHRPDTYPNSTRPYPCVEQRGSYNWIRYGTGFLVERYSFDMKEPCPCPECKPPNQTSNRKSYYCVIKTATHVIFDQLEAQNAVFEFFYNSEDRSTVKKVYGVTVLGPDLLRLETDKCIVMCVTHDGSFAEKLGLLCVPTESLPKGLLISHPHGVSKRVSISDRPRCTLRMVTNKSSVRIHKGTEIRFSNCHDDICVLQCIDRLLDERVIAVDGPSGTFILCCDLTIFRPEGNIVDVDYPGYWKDNLSPETMSKRWWMFCSLDTQLVTDGGKRYSFPYNDGMLSTMTMDVFENDESIFDKIDIDNFYIYSYCRYKMSSCPGSSGAHVRYREDYAFISETGGVHFGGSFDCHNISSLISIHAPGYRQKYETNSMNTWMGTEDERENLLFYSMETMASLYNLNKNHYLRTDKSQLFYWFPHH